MLDAGIVDLGPIADVANNIIDKFAQAVGWAVVPRGKKKDFEIAVDQYISEIQNDPLLDPLIKAAKISSARRDIKAYINMQDILQYASEFAQGYEENTEPLDEDWALFFYERAKNICRDDIKILWGKILAEENRESGSIPKQLIHILSIMSAQNAVDFENVCKFAVNRIFGGGVLGDVMLIIGVDESREILEKVGVLYQTLNDLQSLGLLNVNVIDGRLLFQDEKLEDKLVGFEYHGNIIEIGNLREEVPIGYVSFTEAGRILSNIVVRKSVDDFLGYIKKYYEKNGFTVNIR